MDDDKGWMRIVVYVAKYHIQVLNRESQYNIMVNISDDTVILYALIQTMMSASMNHAYHTKRMHSL